MSYYSTSTGPDVILKLYDSKNRRLAKLSGTMRFPELHLPAKQRNSPPGYPAYYVITVNGIVDIVEHRRMEPIFFMTDDPDVWKAAGVPAN